MAGLQWKYTELQSQNVAKYVEQAGICKRKDGIFAMIVSMTT